MLSILMQSICILILITPMQCALSELPWRILPGELWPSVPFPSLTSSSSSSSSPWWSIIIIVKMKMINLPSQGPDGDHDQWSIIMIILVILLIFNLLRDLRPHVPLANLLSNDYWGESLQNHHRRHYHGLCHQHDHLFRNPNAERAKPQVIQAGHCCHLQVIIIL